MNRTRWILLGGLLPFLGANAAEVSKEVTPGNADVVYSISQDGCDLRWTRSVFEGLPGFGLVERSRCALPPERQTPLRNALLHALMEDTDRLAGLRSFEWGRLLRGDANDVYSQRLAQAAANSRDWNKTKGKPVRDKLGVNHYVTQLLNRSAIFPEVAASFAAAGFELTVAGVEKVLIGPGSVSQGLAATKDKLPFDCIVSFAVTPSARAPTSVPQTRTGNP